MIPENFQERKVLQGPGPPKSRPRNTDTEGAEQRVSIREVSFYRAHHDDVTFKTPQTVLATKNRHTHNHLNLLP